MNCPHRAKSVDHYEDQIAEFLSQNSPYPSRALLKIQNLAQSVHQSNGDFLDTNLLIRAQVCNLVSPTIGKSLDEEAVDATADDDADSDWEEDDEEDKDGEEHHDSQEDDAQPEPLSVRLHLQSDRLCKRTLIRRM